MPLQPFDESYLHPTFRDLFWQMITERMNIYWRRQNGAPPPWTNDPILRTEFITNVYRELDPGTVFLMKKVLHDENISNEDKVFNVLLYRLMGSRVEFHEHLPVQHADVFDAAEFADQCRSVEASTGMSPFGEAYRTAAYSDRGSSEKIVNVSLVMADVANEVVRVLQELRNALTLEQAYRVLEGVRGFGEFLAYQVMVDLLYPAPFDPILPFDQDTWAMAGPGARRGIWQMIKPGMKPNSMLEVMKWLRDNQQQEFERLGLDFPYLVDPITEEPIWISLCNIQSCLCEFFKYSRIWTGDSNTVRRYGYSEPLLAQVDEPSVITVEQPSHVESISDVVVGTSGPDLTSSRDHGLLVGSAATSGELLDGSAGDFGNEEASTPQSPADHTSTLHGSEVSVFSGSQLGFQQAGVRSDALNEAQDLCTRTIDALLEHLIRSGFGIAEAQRLVSASVRNSGGAGQTQIQSDSDKTISIHLHL